MNANIPSNIPKCNCNQDAVSKTVRKEGPNVGRIFYSCSKPEGQRCSYFVFEDEAGNSIKSGQDRNPKRDDTIQCECKLFAKLETVFKDGPNKGRQFYSCVKSSGRCGFLQWLEAGSATIQNVDPKAKCFKCGKNGHYSSNCVAAPEVKRSTKPMAKSTRAKKAKT